jgi:iron complex outermembrane receptor protein
MKGAILFISAACPFFLQAQLKGEVLDADHVPIKAATVTLLNAKDSSILKLAVTEENGAFSFAPIKPGKYILTTTHIGFNKAYSKPLQVDENTKAEPITLVLAKASATLANVNVIVKRPLIEVKTDKMVLNVEGTINSVGTDAFELLKKSPGVTIDNEDNISLSGKNGVQVFIDGKLTPISGQDLSSYLRSIQSAQIEAIEIISNPSARYEAAGNAGILNIRLKKNKSFGTNGSFNIGYGQGGYPKFNTGLSLNYRNQKINVFGNYTYGNSQNYTRTDAYREVADSIFDGGGRRVITDKPHNLKAGVDYFLSKTTTIGIMVNGITGDQIYDNRSTNIIKSMRTGNVDRRLEATNYGVNARKILNSNLNYRFAKADKELNIDADQGYYNVRSLQYQPNYYYNASNAFLYSRIYEMLAPSIISLYSLKASYDANLNKGKLSFGGKYSKVNSDNDFGRYDITGTVKTKDSLRSNSFLYKEGIGAAYVNYSKQYKTTSLSYGVRMENTVASGYSSGFTNKGTTVHYDSLFKRTYLDFFPTASFTYTKNKNNQFIASYGRRIDRPNYQDLNPFEFKVDEYTYRKGNTNLRPQYTNSYGLSHVYKNRLTSTLNYSHIREVFVQIFDTADKTKTFITKSNLATNDVVSVNINYSIQQKRYTGFVNLNSFYTRYKADFGNGRVIDLDAVTAVINGTHSYKFNNGYTAEIAFNYSTPAIGLGTFYGKALGSIDVGLQKSFLANRLTAKAAANDIFFMTQINAYSNFAGQYLRVHRHFEPRVVRLNLTYRFGSNEVKASRQRKTGLEEESKRAQTSG